MWFSAWPRRQWRASSRGRAGPAGGAPGAVALRAVGGQVGLPGLDVVLGLATAAVEVLVQRARRAGGEVGDDEAAVDALRTGLDAGDDALDPPPAGGAG